MSVSGGLPGLGRHGARAEPEDHPGEAPGEGGGQDRGGAGRTPRVWIGGVQLRALFGSGICTIYHISIL